MRRQAAQDADAGCRGGQPDLLGGLAQRGRGGVGITGLCPATRKRDLTRVMPAAVRALGQQDAGVASGTCVEQHQDGGGLRRCCRSLVPRGPNTGLARLHQHGHQPRRTFGQLARQWLQAPHGVLEPHQPSAATRSAS